MSDIPDALGFDTLEEVLSFLYFQIGDFKEEEFIITYTDHCINLLPKDKLDPEDTPFVEWDED
jgi:hypothetical protein